MYEDGCSLISSISKLVMPRENEIKILVTNTGTNRRAVGTSHRISERE